MLVRCVIAAVEVEGQNLFLLTAHDGKYPVRGHGFQGFGELKVVAVFLCRFGFRRVLGPWGRPQRTFRPELGAGSAHQLSVLGRPFDENVAGTVQGGVGIGDALGEELGGHHIRHQVRVGQQAVGQRFQSGFARDLRLGAPLGLVRQVDVLDPRLGVGREQRGLQFVGQLALLLDRGQHRGTALIEFSQVAQPFFQFTQLAVVQAAGDFFAITRNERDRRALVKQPHGGRDLGLGHGQFRSEAGVYRFHGHALSHAEGPYPMSGTS
ncbi:Uncharacterised protein [Mycobacteroides abscessus]|nr:Uncharacterised protein [Mycobacteroides abscessus]